MGQPKNKLRTAVDLWQTRGIKFLLRTVMDSYRKEVVKFFYKYGITHLGKKFYLPIQSLQLEITTKCNLNCVFCDYVYLNTRGKNLTFNHFETILNKLPNLRQLSPQGLGEPLLHPDFFSMLETAKSRSINTYVNTNFTIFSEEKAKRLAVLVDDLVISLSGASSETYENVHRGASFEKVVENIRRFMQIKESLRQKTAEVQIKFIIINKNVQEMQKLVTLAADLGVKNICFEDLIPFKEINDLKVKEERIAKEIGMVKKIAEEKGIRRLIIHLRKKPYAINKCPWPFGRLFIDVNGGVYPCCSLGVFWGKEVPRERFRFGNIFTDDINAIWRGKKMEALRREIAQNKVPEICKEANCLYVQGIDAKE